LGREGHCAGQDRGAPGSRRARGGGAAPAGKDAAAGAGKVSASAPTPNTTSNTTSTVLEVRGLRKVYRAPGGAQIVAVDDLSFSVRRGEIVALLGPNGAGKTTAMQLALRLLDPDAGEARLFGGDPELLDARRRVGYAPDAAPPCCSTRTCSARWSASATACCSSSRAASCASTRCAPAAGAPRSAWQTPTSSGPASRRFCPTERWRATASASRSRPRTWCPR